MDPRRLEQLIDRLEALLGEQATPQRIEEILSLCLEASAEPPPGERIILTAYGCDRPGILARLTQILYEAGVNILDVSQKILQGYFTLILIADISGMHITLRELQERLQQAAEALGIRVLVQHEELFHAMHRP